MLDWRRTEDYQFTQEIKLDLWAWEFLRRNPEYIKDWHWFDQTWQALEKDYGSPPHPHTLTTDKLACVIDLQKSLKEQMQDLRRQLIIAKKNRVSDDKRLKLWCLSLRLLDAEQSGADESEILSLLFSKSVPVDESDRFRGKYALAKELAHHLMNGGCRELIAYNSE